MRIAFVTNRAAHYRVPIFRLLAERCRVDFFFTAAASSGRWWSDQHDESAAGLTSLTGLTPLQLFKALRAGRYDCIAASLTGRTHLAATALSVGIGRKPFVLWVDMWDYPRSILHAFGKPLVRYVIRRADAIVSAGPHSSLWLERDFGRVSDVVPLPNAVDNPLFGSPISADQLDTVRSSFSLDTDVIGCFVGRLEAEKGLIFLLRALHSVPDVGLVIVGSGSQAEAIAGLVTELGLADRVRLVGWIGQDRLPSLYQACDFLVLPSISTPRVREVWGLVANEAMAAGLPVVATDAVGAVAGHLVTDLETGLVVPERNVAALSSALSRIAADKDLRRRLGVKARARVGAYTFVRAAEVFSEALEIALSRQRAEL